MAGVCRLKNPYPTREARQDRKEEIHLRTLGVLRVG